MNSRTIAAGAALACAIFAAGCQQASAPKARDTSADLARINELRSQYASAYNSADAAALAALYTEDGVTMPSDAPEVSGRQAIQEWIQKAFQGSPSRKITITPSETEIVGDWAWERGSATVSMTPQGAKSPVDFTGKYMVILRRQADGSWKVHRDIDNNNAPVQTAETASKK